MKFRNNFLIVMGSYSIFWKWPVLGKWGTIVDFIENNINAGNQPKTQAAVWSNFNPETPTDHEIKTPSPDFITPTIRPSWGLKLTAINPSAKPTGDKVMVTIVQQNGDDTGDMTV
jgi:hypothetical protein